jgi:hypothetical protein
VVQVVLDKAPQQLLLEELQQQTQAQAVVVAVAELTLLHQVLVVLVVLATYK